MMTMNCQKTEALLTTRSMDTLMAHEREGVVKHLEGCESCRRFKETSELLNVAGMLIEPPEMVPLSARRIARAAIDGRLPEGYVPRDRKGSRVVLAAVAAVLIGLVAGGIWLNRSEAVLAPTVPSMKNSPAHAAADLKPVPGPSEWRFTGENTAVALSKTSRVWGSPGTVLRREPSLADDIRLKMATGQIVADVDHRTHRGAFIVKTPRCDVEVRGTLFSVTVEPEGQEVIRVINGTVAVTERDVPDSVQVLEAGQEFVTGMKTPRGADEADLNRDLVAFAPTMKQGELPVKREPDTQAIATGSSRLSELARAHRKARDFEKARETYERLFREYPASDAALDAHVALGQLELTVLRDPSGAIAHFSKYLSRKPSGYLAEEARAGLTGAHRQNNSDAAVIAAATDYLQRHRNGMYTADMLQERADAYVRQGDCDSAMVDLQTILQKFPGSAQAKDASRKLERCTGKAP